MDDSHIAKSFIAKSRRIKQTQTRFEEMEVKCI